MYSRHFYNNYCEHIILHAILLLLTLYKCCFTQFQIKHVMKTPTNSGNSGSSLIKHSNSLRQQQLGLWNNCEDTQDVEGITNCITPTGR